MSSQIYDGCILAAEVAGDSRLHDRLGDAETARAVERCRNRAERAVEAHLGVPLLAQGRRLLAHFPKSDGAVQAAVDMRDRVARLPPVSGTKLFVHIVVHASPPASMANAEKSLAHDEAFVIAAAIGDNQIVVSAEAAGLLSEGVRHQLDLSSPGKVPGVTTAKSVYPLTSDNAPTREESSTPIATDEFDATTHSQSPPSGSSAHARHHAALIVRHMRSNFVVSDSRPILLAGREEGNDLVIADRRASRHHARIEWREDHFVVIDTSTNGTYLIDGAGTEVILHRHEAELPPQGRLGFGFSPLETDAEAISFAVDQR